MCVGFRCDLVSFTTFYWFQKEPLKTYYFQSTNENENSAFEERKRDGERKWWEGEEKMFFQYIFREGAYPFLNTSNQCIFCRCLLFVFDIQHIDNNDRRWWWEREREQREGKVSWKTNVTTTNRNQLRKIINRIYGAQHTTQFGLIQNQNTPRNEKWKQHWP